MGERVVANIRLKVQENLLRQSPSFYEENSPKEISSRMTSDTAIIETVVGTTVSVALRNSLTAIGGILLLLYLAAWAYQAEIIDASRKSFQCVQGRCSTPTR